MSPPAAPVAPAAAAAPAAVRVFLIKFILSFNYKVKPFNNVTFFD